MIKKVKKAIEQFDMLKSGDSVCVALSGGADSVSLLWALCSLKEKLNISISAAHLNHKLRGAESERDEAFVRELCEKLCVPLTVKSVDVAAIAKETGESIELAARNARYEFFGTLSEAKIATAHTASDNLETVLLNLSRGTAINGLCGIPVCRERFIRPLILCTRAEVEAFCTENSLTYVTDSTNLSDEYTRNGIRHHVVPALKRNNASLEATVTKTCQSLSVDRDFLDGEAKKLFERCLQGEKLIVPSGTHRALLVRMVALLISKMTSRNADNVHLNEICDAFGFNRRIELFSGYYAHVNKNSLQIFDASQEENVEYIVSTSVVSREEYDNLRKINNLLLNDAIDYDKICGELKIRTRLDGDRITLRGRRVTKSLRKLYNENKILKSLRDVLPVAADDNGIVWVCGQGVSASVSVGKKTEKVLIFDYEITSKHNLGH